MNPTQSTPAPEKSVHASCQPLVETLVKLGSTWAAHGLKIGRDAVKLSAETLGKTVETLDSLAAEFEKRAARAKSDVQAPEAGEAAPADKAETGAAAGEAETGAPASGTAASA